MRRSNREPREEPGGAAQTGVRQGARAGSHSLINQAAGDITMTVLPRSASRWAPLTWGLVFVVCSALVFVAVYFQGPIMDAFAGGPALKVAVLTQGPRSGDGAWWLPGKLVPPGDTLSGTDPTALVAKRSDAVDTFVTTTKLTVTGARSGNVTLSGIHLEILKRTALTTGGTLVVNPPQGEDPTIQLGFDLDERTPIARGYSSGATPLGGGYFPQHSWQFRNGETHTFVLTFLTLSSDVTYDLVLDEAVDGKAVEQRVTNGAHPFHTRGFASAYDQQIAPGPQGDWAVGSAAAAIQDLCTPPCVITKARSAG